MNAPVFVFNQKERDEKKGERIADQLEMIIRSDEKKRGKKREASGNAGTDATEAGRFRVASFPPLTGHRSSSSPFFKFLFKSSAYPTPQTKN